MRPIFIQSFVQRRYDRKTHGMDDAASRRLMLSLTKHEAMHGFRRTAFYPFSCAALRPAIRPNTWPETSPVPAG